MTRKQRSHYFKVLWPEACKRQGWNASDAALRRDVTLHATGKSSSSGLSQAEITLLFDYLKLLADPDNLAKAMPVGNPAAPEFDNRRRQLLHIITGLGFPDAYIEPCARGFLHAEGKPDWRDLSVKCLEKLRYTLTTRARQRAAAAGQRPPFEPKSVPYHQRPNVRRDRAAKRAAEREPRVLPRPGVEEAADFPF